MSIFLLGIQVNMGKTDNFQLVFHQIVTKSLFCANRCAYAKSTVINKI